MNADLLAQLAPAHAPPPAGWWPLAPGWWLLAGVLAALVALTVYLLRRRSFRLRRAALKELRQIEAAASAGGDAALVARRIEQLLRRFALARFGRATVARLSGEAWIAFVAAHGGSALSGEPGQQLLRATYGGANGGAATADRAAWLDGARGFLRKARP